MGLTWKRDVQGLHADSTDGELRFYVRRVETGWRAAVGDLEEVAGIRIPVLSRPMETIDVADTQRMAKAVAEAYDVEPWNDGSAKRRSTRAIERAYA